MPDMMMSINYCHCKTEAIWTQQQHLPAVISVKVTVNYLHLDKYCKHIYKVWDKNCSSMSKTKMASLLFCSIYCVTQLWFAWSECLKVLWHLVLLSEGEKYFCCCSIFCRHDLIMSHVLIYNECLWIETTGLIKGKCCTY